MHTDSLGEFVKQLVHALNILWGTALGHQA